MRRPDNFEEECDVGGYSIFCGVVGVVLLIFGFPAMFHPDGPLIGAITTSIGFTMCFFGLKWTGTI